MVKKVYNQLLIGILIEIYGVQKIEEIFQGWVNNLVIDVFVDDNVVIQVVDVGQCDVGIVNIYYYGCLYKQNLNLWVKLFWLNQVDCGVYVNLLGIGLICYVLYFEVVKVLVEWMIGFDVQVLFVGINQEFLVNLQVVLLVEVVSWGSFKVDSILVEVVGKCQVEVICLMDCVGWN